MADISIVVPVYNVEAFLRTCVESILRQPFADFDLVLVDDGSTDGSGAMCDDYAASDPRVRTLHKANGGLSSARNAGIEWALDHSDSRWLLFVDSDDWIAPNGLGLLRRAAERAPLSLGAVAYVDNAGKTREIARLPGGTVSPEKVFVSHRSIGTWAWGKLYRKSDFAALRYPDGRFYEDRFTTHKVFFKYREVATVPEVVYYYREARPGNIVTRRLTEKLMQDRVDGLREQLSFFEKEGYGTAARFAGERLAVWLADCVQAAPDPALRGKVLAMIRDGKARYWHSLWRSGLARKRVRQALHPAGWYLWTALWIAGGMDRVRWRNG